MREVRVLNDRRVVRATLEDNTNKHCFALDTDGYPGMRCDKSREYALSQSV